MSTNAQRLPVVFLPHGGGPWPFVKVGIGSEAEQAELATYLRGLPDLPASPPRALLVISAHWEEGRPTVTNGPQPPLLFDYYGFPAESYQLTWPAPGEPALAARVQELLVAAGIPSAANAERGFDHGTFVPLKLAYPDADIPTVQLSLVAGLDPAQHLALGRALVPLRDEGVFIVGSGMSYHNMRGFSDPRASAHAEAFDRWLADAVEAAPSDRDRALGRWANAPSARACHPREEHLLPLMVVAGAAGEDRGRAAFRGQVFGKQTSAFHFGGS
ncbi:MAG: dioxygenase [Deltaproteobacteria bacterium]|nr:dioxygenase [Nannocystaceae bacterium]